MQQPGAPSFLGLVLDAGSREGRASHGGREVGGAMGGGGAGTVRTLRTGAGGHRFWQHCSLLGFCPSVVGGTLMSHNVVSVSSCAAVHNLLL